MKKIIYLTIALTAVLSSPSCGDDDPDPVTNVEINL